MSGITTSNKDPRFSALRKCWKGYYIAKRMKDKVLQKEYAEKITNLAFSLGLQTPSFPELNN